ncbi:FGGY family carbohydrate kinase [Tunturibacter psychrotolerans]|uniref:FGGY family carbohydrate kinase n=1 Tax=Tunturiibacter psychrotolerans TaxID=3069686 RepID=A0AAU7ZWT1_9BACT
MLLGIDVGTGGTRAVLIDLSGAVVASSASEHAGIHSAQIGWAEQDPEDWWRATREALAGVMAASEFVLVAEEGAAFGAALLAGTGTGVWQSVEAACAATVHVAQTIAPKNAAVMDQAHKQYRRIYPALQEIARS